MYSLSLTAQYQKIWPKNETIISPYIFTNKCGQSVLFYCLKMSERLKRSVNRLDYRQLADVKIPKAFRSTRRRDKVTSSTDATLYRLRIVEEDEENGLVKVAYIGYSERFDEWRRVEEIVNLEENEDDNDIILAPSQLPKFCLFQELASKIKTQLFSSRKTNPTCCVTLSFD